MAAVFPSSVKVFVAKTDLVDSVLADHVNVLQDEVNATQSTLGLGLLSSAWGSTWAVPATHASVSARLTNIESNLGFLSSTTASASTGVTLAGVQTLTNKTLTTPKIDSVLTNTGTATVTFPLTADTLVGKATTDTLTNKTLTAPKIATILTNAGAATLTLPTSTDTLVGLATTDTLLNKTLTLPTIGGTGAKFNGSVSGTTTLLATAAAGTTSLTLPAATDTLVGKATTDTLTNKTLTAPAIAAGTLTGTLTATGATISGGTVNATTLQQAGVQAATISDAQALTNKTINGSLNTLSNIPQTAVTGLSGTYAPLAGATFTGAVTVVSPTAAISAGVRQVWITSVAGAPSNATGADGDLWIVYV
jgi:hypothetical protein